MARVSLLIIACLLTTVIVAGCSDSGTDSDPPPQTANVTVTVVPQLDGKTYAEAEIFDNATNTKLGDGQTEVTREEGTSLTIRIEGPDIETQTNSLSFNRDKTESIGLSRSDPDTATLSYRINNKDGELAENTSLFVADTLAADSPEGSISIPFGETITACGRGDYYDEGCEDLTLNGDKTITLTVTRQQVTITITPEIDDFDAKSREEEDDLNFFKYKLSIGFLADGQLTNRGPNGALLQEGKPVNVQVPAGNEPITVSGQFLYRKQNLSYGEQFPHRSLAVGEMNISPTSDKSIILNLQHQLACQDGIDNDLVEGAGNDETAVGCVADASPTFERDNPDWIYDSEDDDERLLFSRITYNLQQKKLKFVSSKDGERRSPLLGNTFPEDVKFAAGEVLFDLDNAIEATETGESFALEINCYEQGTDPNTARTLVSNIVADDPDIEGWRKSTVRGITRDHFKNNGIECGIILLHGTLARGESPGDGNDDVVVRTDKRAINLERVLAIEPENLPPELQPKANPQQFGVHYFSNSLR